jgi:lipopolysaccharide biosynthesis glycosyltransferase
MTYTKRLGIVQKLFDRNKSLLIEKVKVLSFIFTIIFMAPWPTVLAQSYSTESLTRQTLHNPNASHLEKLKALEVMAREYEAAGEIKRKTFPDLYKTAFEALISHDVDAALELAYTCKGLNNSIMPDKTLSLDIILPYIAEPKAKALKEFLLVRDLELARDVHSKADTPRSRAVAYMVLADAYYAKNNISKAILFATLSLAQDFTKAREEQAKFYLTTDKNSDLSLKGSREDVLSRLNERMSGIYNPRTFRRYFSMATILGLLPSFPLNHTASSSTDPMNMCMAFDDRFAMHGAVTMLSAMLSADPNSRYTFYVMEDTDNLLDEAYKERVCDMVNEIDGGRFEVAFVPVDKSILPESIQGIEKFRSWPRLVFFKLYIPDTFSNLDRILWLDADLIVRDDLSEIYHTPMNGKWFAGVRDYGGDKVDDYLPVSKGAPYLNVGVLLYDIEAINKASGCGRIGEYCIKNAGFENGLKYPEQDMFAIMYPDTILELEHQKPVHLPDGQIQIPKWNWFYKTSEMTHWTNVHNHSASIIHMAGGGLKPWRRKSSPTLWSWAPKRNDGVQNVYWALRDMGPWATQF